VKIKIREQQSQDNGSGDRLVVTVRGALDFFLCSYPTSGSRGDHRASGIVTDTHDWSPTAAMDSVNFCAHTSSCREACRGPAVSEFGTGLR